MRNRTEQFFLCQLPHPVAWTSTTTAGSVLTWIAICTNGRWKWAWRVAIVPPTTDTLMKTMTPSSYPADRTVYVVNLYQLMKHGIAHVAGCRVAMDTA